MRAHIYCALAGFVGLFSAGGAFATPPKDLSYDSAFEQFDSYQPTQKREWKSANDNVGKLGGWRYYAREANPQSEGGSRSGLGSPTPEDRQKVNKGHAAGHVMPQGMTVDHDMPHGDSHRRGKP